MDIFIMDESFPITRPKKKLTLAAVSGEWWIDRDGSAEFADSSVGDYGHEALVIDYVRSLYGYGPLSETWKEYIMKRGRNYIAPMLADPEMRTQISMEFDNDPMKFIKEAFAENGMTEDEWLVANDMADGRDYAMKELGWIRVSRRSIQVHTLDNETLSRMIKGLEDIFDQTGVEDGEEGEFDIEISGGRKYLVGIPYDAIKSARRSGDVGELMSYAHGSWTFAGNGEGMVIMGENEPLTISQFTGQRNTDRLSLRDNDLDPLSEDENKRLVELKTKVDAAGTPSILNEKECKEYEDLGLRHNLTKSMSGDVLLPTAIKPWITQ